MTEKEVLLGLPKITKNAKLLYEDAEFLEKIKRLERAYSLFQLSLEEIAKAFILLRAILFEDISDQTVQKRLNSEIHRHTIKLKKSINIEIFLSSFLKSIDEKKYGEWNRKLINEYKDTDLMNNKKNYGFYVSYNENKFMSPSELIKKEDVDYIKHKAWVRIHFGSKFINAMIPNFSKIKSKADKIDYSTIEQQ